MKLVRSKDREWKALRKRCWGRALWWKWRALSGQAAEDLREAGKRCVGLGKRRGDNGGFFRKRSFDLKVLWNFRFSEVLVGGRRGRWRFFASALQWCFVFQFWAGRASEPQQQVNMLESHFFCLINV